MLRCLSYLRIFCLFILAMIFCFSAISAPQGSLKRVAYFTEWGVYGREYEIADVPAAHLTHLLYAFAVIDPETYECKIYDHWAAVQKVFEGKNGFPAQSSSDSEQNKAGNFERIKILKERYPHLKVLLSVGGWTKSSEFSKAVTDEIYLAEQQENGIFQEEDDPDRATDTEATITYRTHFVQSCIRLMNQYGFDGLDYDWEYPVAGGLEENDHRPQDKQNFTELLRETRAALRPSQELTIAVTPNIALINNLEVLLIANLVDAMHVMAYDYHGPWNSFAGHLAPLYPSSKNRFEEDRERLSLNIEATIKSYIEQGVRADQLVLGVPFYGRAWIAAEHHPDHGLYQPAAAQKAPQDPFIVPGNWEDANFDIWKIHQLVESGKLTAYEDTVAHAPYAYSAETGLFISYDTPVSLKEKIDYVHTHHLGGIMVWDLSGDIKKFEQSYLKVIDEHLN